MFPQHPRFRREDAVVGAQCKEAGLVMRWYGPDRVTAIELDAIHMRSAAHSARRQDRHRGDELRVLKIH